MKKLNCIYSFICSTQSCSYSILISDFKIGQLRTSDDVERGRGPGSRLPAHAHFGVSSVLRCVVAGDGVYSRIFA